MIERIEKLMNSSCKEDILLAMHLVKHHTGIQSPVVIMWWIQRRCKIYWYPSFYRNRIDLSRNGGYNNDIIKIDHSELE